MAELTERVTVTNPALQFRVMDAADLHPLDDQSFDLVVDKGASMPTRNPKTLPGALYSALYSAVYSAVYSALVAVWHQESMAYQSWLCTCNEIEQTS